MNLVIFLVVPKRVGSFECSFVNGTSKSDGGLTINGVETEEECSRVCWAKRSENSAIRSATVQVIAGTVVCQCNSNFTVEKTHQACTIAKPQGNPNSSFGIQ